MERHLKNDLRRVKDQARDSRVAGASRKTVTFGVEEEKCPLSGREQEGLTRGHLEVFCNMASLGLVTRVKAA